MAKKKDEVSLGKFQDTMNRLNKTYGIGTILSLEDKPFGKYEVISTGSLAFDWRVLGIGGFAKGKLYELMGWEGTGKSTVCGHAVAECQKKEGTALYIDGEHALDKNYFQALGVDTTKMLISQPSCGEEGFNIALEMINSGSIDLIIIDSDSSLIPKKQLDGEVGDSTLGRKAILNSNAYPKLKTALSKNNVCVIVVSQYREKIGVMFGNPTTTQGGHALKFYSDCRIEISKSLAKDGEEIYGNLTKIRTTKNKMNSPYKKCEFDIIYGEGISRFNEVLELGIEFEIIKKSGSWFSYGETKLGQGKDGIKELLKDNPELFQEIEQKVINLLKPTTEEIKTDEM